MISFIKENSYNMVKFLLDQFAFTVLGTMLAIATYKNHDLLLWSSIFSVLVYLAVIYSVGWEIGARDKIKIDGGRMRPFPTKGLWIALGANTPNLLLALLMGLGVLIGSEWATNMSFTCNAIARLAEGMYLGIIKVMTDLIDAFDGVADNIQIAQIWWWFIVITLPAIFTGWFSYLMGSNNKRISTMLGIKMKPEKHE